MPEGINPWNNEEMKRLKFLFAGILLFLAIPFWRFGDVLAIIAPFDWPLAMALMIWFAVFIAIPAKLIFPKIKTYYLIPSILSFGSLVWWMGPLSNQATLHPELNHCGSITYTGLTYPMRKLLSEAHRDDLEVRNQMCWVRKMISKVPQRFDSMEDLEAYSNLIREKLLRPEIKYRAALPMIAVLYFTINTSSVEVVRVKEIYDSLHFWRDQYTEEISLREYSLWNWPHSDYIKFEYGLIEKNWEKLIESIVVEII